MASGGGDQGYWPGFVDALSNMVMTLIIIIVLLNVALVFFFYKASKTTSHSIEAAVEAVKKDKLDQIESLRQENKLLQEEIKKAQEQVLSATMPKGGTEKITGTANEKNLAAGSMAGPAAQSQGLSFGQNSNGLMSDQSAVKSQYLEMSSVAQSDKGDMRDTKKGAEKIAPTVKPDAAQAPIKDEKSAQSKSIPSTDMGAGQFDATKQEGQPNIVADKNLNNRYTKIEKEASNTNSENILKNSDNVYIISYEDDSVELSQNTITELNNELKNTVFRNKNINIDIKVEINNINQYSYMRRVAYYRASVIRNYFLSNGVDPKRIETRLVDAEESSKSARAFISFSK